jgi:hypothetical protein
MKNIETELVMCSFTKNIVPDIQSGILFGVKHNSTYSDKFYIGRVVFDTVAPIVLTTLLGDEHRFDKWIDVEIFVQNWIK